MSYSHERLLDRAETPEVIIYTAYPVSFGTTRNSAPTLYGGWLSHSEGRDLYYAPFGFVIDSVKSKGSRMPSQEWKQVSERAWATTPDDEGVYGRVYAEKASDGVYEYWAMSCVEGDVPCDPLETAEVMLSLAEAQELVESHLLQGPSNDTASTPSV